MPNFENCPAGMDYGQWLREKSIGIRMGKPLLHTDSGIPTDVHSKLKHKNRELFERTVKRQGKVILPEDM